MAAYGRLRLYAITGIELPVLAGKRSLIRLEFQHCDGQVSAKSGTSSASIFAAIRVKSEANGYSERHNADH